ncbi:DUF1620-domain-containing protein [Gonapodya prolifera JEL478]|uniref:ER membrane protein complex subunit 1 n=1 Tax=Gonapodya prolifera (strain JEL478) TaxID=1344416 RepID=A0A138ZZA8_GONPJ|nr:DUF1620-domain-containing protein [Gonapodya prolifera JEL478]|eukprot:KXS09605.1 DUF1620-domain-containing protein [Gonapodya prolifera JEL478]
MTLKVNLDGTIEVHDNGKFLWERDESLAMAVDALFVDLPEEEMFSLEHTELAEGASPLERYSKRWSRHLAKLMALTPLDITSRFWGAPREKTSVLYRDAFGFRKIAVVLSRNGKVVGFDTEGGSVVWSVHLGGEQFEGRRLEILRSTAVKFPPILAVVGNSGQSATTIRLLNGITGEDFTADTDPFKQATTTVDAKVASIIKLPIEEPHERTHVLALLDTDSKVHLFPNTAETRAAFAEFSPSYYFYEQNQNNGLLGRQAVIDDNDGAVIDTRETWRVNFAPGESITVLGTPWNGRVASVGRVLGNRSVLYKYLNPNLLAVATHRKTPQPQASLYLVDTVKGAVQYAASYSVGADAESQPNYGHHLVQWENVVLFSYWNSGGFEKRDDDRVEPPPIEPAQEGGEKKRKRRRRRRDTRAKAQELVVLEVFESEFVDKRIESRNFSSFENGEPYVAAQAYVFPSAISSVGVTQTHAGITTREVLFGLPSGQIVGVNKKQLDPRRPIGNPSADDKEEGLLPYNPLIALNPKDVANYYLKVLGIEHIVSSPAFLESTSLVLGYGLDLFYTRRNPSKTFDVLSEDFNRVALLGTIAALVVGIAVGRHIVRDNDRDCFLRDATI